jgi:hypothetical protein
MTREVAHSVPSEKQRPKSKDQIPHSSSGLRSQPDWTHGILATYRDHCCNASERVINRADISCAIVFPLVRSVRTQFCKCQLGSHEPRVCDELPGSSAVRDVYFMVVGTLPNRDLNIQFIRCSELGTTFGVKDLVKEVVEEFR